MRGTISSTGFASATAHVDGRDLGVRAPLRPACRFGFSESPPWPSIVEVAPALGVPDGWLPNRQPRLDDIAGW